MKVINLNGIRKKIILSTFNDKGIMVKVIMMPITEKQEAEIDKELCFKINGTVIQKGQIYVYGEVNFSEDDLNKIDRIGIIVPEDGGWIYSNLDLNTGEVTIENNTPKMYPTFDPITWFEYNHLLLGKPKRIIIFKCPKTLNI